MKFKKTVFCLLGVCGLALPLMSSCGSSSSATTSAGSVASNHSSTTSASSATSSETWSIPTSGLSVDDLSSAQTLSMSVFYNSSDTGMKFQTSSKVTYPYKAADGKSYNPGDFKPVWAAVQKNLNMTIDDVTDTSTGSIQKSFVAMQTNGFAGVNIAQGNSDDIIAEGIQNNDILDLHQYMDVMPNFKTYLENNPVIRKQIQDADGHIYYAPYFDGFDDVEKMLIMRADWVEKLLDGTYTAADYDTAKSVSKAYTRFGAESVDEDIQIVGDDKKASTVHKAYSKGEDVITEQNALPTMNGASLVKTLRDYIDKTYGNAYGTKRSELFLGGRPLTTSMSLSLCIAASMPILVS